MIERNMGQVVPFRLSAGKLRRSAQEHHRRGRPMEAVELLRRAAQQEDTPAAWLHLARELRLLACYEQAATVLYRVLARPQAPMETWLELARCQAALGKTESAVDSLYHYLAEDPYSDIADEARSMLSRLDEGSEPQDAFRLPLLIRRGLTAWREGRRELGQRRLKRAIRMAERPGRLYVTMGLLLMADGRCEEAVRALNAARRCQPDDPRAAGTLCVALNAIGRRRAALGLLEHIAPLCQTAEGEEIFLTAAWTLEAHDQREAFLVERHRQQPYRIMLMHHLADLRWEQQRREEAAAWWQRVLRLDPADVRARAMLRNALQDGRQHMPVGTLPATEAQLMLQELARADEEHMSPEEMIRPGSDCRTAMDWCFAISNEGIQQKGLEVLAAQDSPATRAYMRELLTSPTVHPAVRNKVMLHLVDLGETGPMNVLLGQRMTTAECTPVPQGKQSLWHAFMGKLLHESRRHRQSEAIIELACELWPMLTERQQHAAAGLDSFVWAKAVEILYLRMTAQDEAAAHAVRHTPVSMRKISRVLRAIARRMDIPPQLN